MKDFEEKIWRNKVIMVFPFDLQAHYLRSIVLVKKHSENCKIIFQSSMNYNDSVLKEGFHLFKSQSFDTKKVMNAARKFDFSWLNEIDINRVYYSQIEAIKKNKPDIVIGDTAPTLKMASEKLGIQFYALKNIYLSTNYSFHRKLSITHPGHKHLAKLPQNVADKITSFVEKIAFKQVHKPFKKLRKKEGLKKITNYLQESDGDVNLFCDDPNLFPLKKVEKNDIILGPLLYKNDQREDSIIKKLDKNKPTICVTMGSSGEWSKIAFLNDKKFSRYNIVTGGDKDKVLNASHIIGKSFINLSEILSQSKLLICHGGNGTIYHSIRHHVFALCLTSHFEQEWNVHALERSGLGLHINNKSESDVLKLIQKHT